MNTKETTKNLLQNILDGINDITGKEDVTLTDGVNALVSGYGQGGSGGSLEGLANGYDVMFYDENNEGLAFYSIKQGHSIEAPIYNCKNWQDANGGVITFPYTPSTDAIFYANNITYADQLYTFYGIDKAVYPQVLAFSYSNQWMVCFGTYDSTTSKMTNAKFNSSWVRANAFTGSTCSEYVQRVMEVIEPSKLDKVGGTWDLKSSYCNDANTVIADTFDYAYTTNKMLFDLNE